MTITTRFNVNDLVKHKFDTPAERRIVVAEVLEIFIQQCYGGTQIWYLCRRIQAEKLKLGLLGTSSDASAEKWAIGHHLSREDGAMGWQKYREDELIPATPEEQAIINHVK